jgi:predicted Zn-ribbon and HTH transcriptional regulator
MGCTVGCGYEYTVLVKHVCKKCGHIWVPRIPNPQMCPRCKTYNWKKVRGGECGGGRE